MLKLMNKQKKIFLIEDIEKYVRDVKLKKNNYNNYWIRTIMNNNFNSTISYCGKASIFSPKSLFNYSPSLRIILTKASPLFLAIYPKLKKARKQVQTTKLKTLMKEALERENRTVRTNKDRICIYLSIILAISVCLCVCDRCFSTTTGPI